MTAFLFSSCAIHVYHIMGIMEKPFVVRARPAKANYVLHVSQKRSAIAVRKEKTVRIVKKVLIAQVGSAH